jgi:hypothetical protein
MVDSQFYQIENSSTALIGALQYWLALTPTLSQVWEREQETRDSAFLSSSPSPLNWEKQGGFIQEKKNAQTPVLSLQSFALTPPSPPAPAPLSQAWERGWG